MSKETPGFEEKNMYMSDEEKATLTDKDLKTQVKREIYNEDLGGSGVFRADKIRKDASKENWDDEFANEMVIRTKDPTNEDAIEKASQKVHEAYKGWVKASE
ncbi:MAG: hypothetical protein WC783_03800 [Candidatus Paceibacterota bacterium]|jgi:hypothetical protein